jgi:hypothetical protein
VVPVSRDNMKTNYRSSIGQAGSKERLKKSKGICLAATALLLLAAWSANAQEGAFVWDGNRLQPVTNTRDLACRKWSIWLFTSDDHAKVPGGQWGNIVGESESDVLDQLKHGQEEDDVVTRGSRNPHGDAWLSHRNYTGPICNVKPPDADVKDSLDQLESLGHRLDQAYSVIRKLLPGHASELEDQVKQLAETLQRVNKLRNDLEQRQRSAMMTINSSIDEITHKTDALESKSQQIAQRLGSGTNVAAQPPATGSAGLHTVVQASGGKISQELTTSATGYTAVFVVSYDSGLQRTVTVDVPYPKIGGISEVQPSSLYPGYWTVTIYAKRDPSGDRMSPNSNFAEVVQEGGTSQPNQNNSVELDFQSEAEAKAAQAFLSARMHRN